MATIKDNKTFQTIVGAATLYLIYVLWRDGWIEWVFGDRDPEPGFSNAQLWLAVWSAIISFVQLVGIVTIGVVSGVLPHVNSLIEFASKKLTEGIAFAKNWIIENRGKTKDEGQWDWRPLAVLILTYALWTGGQLSEIWKSIEGLIPDAISTVDGPPTSAIFFIEDSTVTDAERSIATSLDVSDMLDSKGVERRMLSSNQDAGTSERWLSEAIEFAEDDKSSLVLYYADGKLKSLSIPKSIKEMREIVSAW